MALRLSGLQAQSRVGPVSESATGRLANSNYCGNHWSLIFW